MILRRNTKERIKMETGLQKNENGMSLKDRVTEVLEQVRAVDQLMKQVMKEGEHYGKIPGTDKPTLLKSGAEKLCVLFRIAPEYKETINNLSGPHREYIIRCRLISRSSGEFYGEGMGSASTMEKKWRYRNAKIKCPDCGAETIYKDKEKGNWYCWGKKGGCGTQFPANHEPITSQQSGQVENPDIADIYNTCLKIATKRALVAAVLNATGASDIFTQDLEDMPDLIPQEKDVSPKQPKQTQKTDAQKYEELPQDIKDRFEKLGLILDRRIAGCIKYKWDQSVIITELDKMIVAKEKQNPKTAEPELSDAEKEFLKE